MPLPCTLCLAFFEEPIHPSLGKPDLSCRTRLPAGISGNKQRLPTLQSWVLPKAQRTALRWRLLIQKEVCHFGQAFFFDATVKSPRKPQKPTIRPCGSTANAPKSRGQNTFDAGVFFIQSCFREPLKIHFYM